MNVKTVETAASEYERLAAEVKGKMAALQARLDKHAAAQKADPKNWGLAGDMAYFSRHLGQLLGEEE